MRWAGHVACIREKRKTYKILVGKPDRRRALGRRSCRWAANINMGLKKIGGGGVDWINLALERDKWWTLVNTAMDIHIPQNGGCLEEMRNYQLLKKDSVSYS
jgi:hypothetical protein